MNLKLSKKNPLLWLYAGGAILILVAAGFWCYKTYTNPERVFWATIERGLATSGVTVQAQQSNQGTSADQTIRYSLGAQNISHSLTKLTQANTTVVNEVVGTPTADYTRYVDIKTDQKKADGTPIDVSKLLGVWATGQPGSSQFFTQAVFGAALPVGGMGIPLGNLQPEARGKLVKQIRGDNVYQTSFDKTKQERVHGRLQYTYDVSVQPVSYVAMMKQLSADLGLHGLDQLDPTSYKDQKPFQLQLTIDVRSRHVVRVSVANGKGSQTYSSYDMPVQIEVPKKTITGAQLQRLLSNLQ